MTPGDSHRADGAPGSYPLGGSVRIPARILAEVVAHARAAFPHEACGVAGGRPGEVERLYPLSNASASAERYTVDPTEQLAAYRAMAEEGLECVAVYHSHPHTPARPSAADIAEAYDPDVAYAIASLAAEPPVVRAYRIRDGAVTELEIDISEAAETGSSLSPKTEG